VLFLYPASSLGLTSPVGGPLGRFAVDGLGQVSLTPEQSMWLSSEHVLRANGPQQSIPLRDFCRQIQSVTGGLR